MISEKEIVNARENFILASKDFDFVFYSPFILTDTLASFGFIENYGSKNGTVVCLTSPTDFRPDPKIVEWCEQNKCFWSFINVETLLGEYKRSYFRELLRDWGRY